MTAQAVAIPLPEILHCLDTMQSALERMYRGGDRRIELEMALIRLCSPELDSTNDAILRRLEALERQIRLNTPVTRQQVRYLSAAMKEHTLELLDKSSISDPKAVRKLAGIIKKDVLADYGITTLEEIPKHEYNVAMHNIKTWNNMRIVREVVKEARKREEEAAEAALADAEPATG